MINKYTVEQQLILDKQMLEIKLCHLEKEIYQLQNELNPLKFAMATLVGVLEKTMGWKIENNC